MKLLHLLSGLLLLLSGCSRAWDPSNAAVQAQQDIRAGQLRFYFCGGRAPTAPGVPAREYILVSKYPQAVAGSDLGCSGSTEQQREYARRYNEVMLAHVGRHPDT